MKKLSYVLIISLFIAVPSFADLSDSYSVKFQGVSPQLGVNIRRGGSYLGTQAGQYQIKLKDGDTEDILGKVSGTSNTYNTFCIDIWDSAPSKQYSTKYNLVSLDQSPDQYGGWGPGPMGTEKAGYLATLLDTYWDLDGTVHAQSIGGSSYTAKQAAAALQVAVWEIVTENKTDPTDGSFVWDVKKGDYSDRGNFYIKENDVANLANKMLSNLVCTSDFSNYRALTNNCFQDFVLRVEANVPVPAAVILGVLGMAVAGVKLRKFA